MTPVVGDIIESTVGRVVERLTDRWLPPTATEKERAELAVEARRLAVEEARAAAGELASARALATADSAGSPEWTRALAATHRPAWSFVTLAFFSWTIAAPYLGFPQLPLSELHKDVMQTVIIFYFGGRSVEKAVGVLSGR